MGILRTHHLAPMILCACTACAGNGDGLDSNGRPIGESADNGAPLVATFESIQSHVFTPVCTTCHAGASAPVGLRLDATNSYGLLVGVSSTENPGTLRVKPGDPDDSYIVQKLEGHAAVGAQMPLGGPPLPASTIAVIRQWITDGASRAPQAAGAAVNASALQVITTSPAPAASIDFSPRQIVINFDGDIDVSTVDPASSIRLSLVSDTAGAVLIPCAVTVSPGNAQTLVITPASALVPGRYRVEVIANPGLAIADVQSRTLAEDFTFDFTLMAVQ